MSGGFASSSQLLSKQAELKRAQADYETLRKTYPANIRSNFTDVSNINAISNVNPPPGISPGEDFGEYWKAIIDNKTVKTVDTCITAAVNDPRLFKTVVYTGNSNLSTDWNKKCYGLIYNAPNDASNTTNRADGYITSTPTSSSGGYTKTGISSSSDVTNIENASRLYDLEKKINQLTRDIIIIAPSAIDASFNILKTGAADSNEINNRINNYMNTGATDISANQLKMEKTQNNINIYDDINSQIQLKTHKYRFFIYFVIALALVVGLLSYLSKLSLMEQIQYILKFLEGKWWASWYVVTFVIVLLILSSFGWDMRGNIMMIVRYLTDPKFWTGELWWIGITFLLLIVIYFYSAFKSLFISISSSLEGLDSGIT
jgi:hypothetical protein